MTVLIASYVAMSLSFVALALFAVIHVIPWMESRSSYQALTPLLWVHAGRHIALQLFSSQSAGLAVSDSVRDQIVYGDLAGMVLSLTAIVALHRRARFATNLVWLFVVVTVADLGNALVGGAREGLLGLATDVSWMILNFYVPALWVSLALIVWQLLRTRGQKRVEDGA